MNALIITLGALAALSFVALVVLTVRVLEQQAEARVAQEVFVRDALGILTNHLERAHRAQADERDALLRAVVSRNAGDMATLERARPSNDRHLTPAEYNRMLRDDFEGMGIDVDDRLLAPEGLGG